MFQVVIICLGFCSKKICGEKRRKMLCMVLKYVNPYWIWFFINPDIEFDLSN